MWLIYTCVVDVDIKGSISADACDIFNNTNYTNISMITMRIYFIYFVNCFQIIDTKNEKMNFISGKPEDCISLPKLRDTLIRLEDTIIFGKLLKILQLLIDIMDFKFFFFIVDSFD